METIVKIDEIGFDRLNNAEYSYFSTRFVDLVHTAGKKEESEGTEKEMSNLGFAWADFSVYKGNQDKFIDAVSASQINLETEEMEACDKQRDECVVYLFAILRAEKSSPVEARRKAANTLSKVLSPYAQCYRLAKQQETAQIEGLLVDMKKEENTSLVKLLGLNDVVTGLEESNGMYIQLSSQRNHELAVNRLENTRDLRKRLDEYYDYLTNVAFANSICNPSDKISAFITDLNALIKEVRTRLNQRLAQLKANKKKEEEEKKGEEENTEA